MSESGFALVADVALHQRQRRVHIDEHIDEHVIRHGACSIRPTTQSCARVHHLHVLLVERLVVLVMRDTLVSKKHVEVASCASAPPL